MFNYYSIFSVFLSSCLITSNSTNCVRTLKGSVLGNEYASTTVCRKHYATVTTHSVNIPVESVHL